MCRTFVALWMLVGSLGCASRPIAVSPPPTEEITNQAPPPTLERARAFERGTKVARDYAAAAQVYEQLCQEGRGDAAACSRLLHAAAAGRGFDDDRAHSRLRALARALCERQHHAIACYVAAMSYHDEGDVPPALLAELENPRHSCEAGDVDACELVLGEFDISGSSGREARRRKAAAIACAKDSIAGCAYLVNDLGECAYVPGATRCRDKQLAQWKKDDHSENLGAFGKLDAACSAGDTDACAAIPGREVPRKDLCAARDYNACAELGCLGDKSAAAIAEAHGGWANCHGLENLEAARTAPVPPEPVADPPLPPIVPADKQPFETLAFRKLTENDHNGWPRFEIHNLGKRTVASVDVVAYGYDAAGTPIVRDWGTRVQQAIAPGAHVEADVTDMMRHSDVPDTVTTFDVCYEGITFAGDPTVYRARCPNVRKKGALASNLAGVVAIGLHPVLPWEGQYNHSWIRRAFDDAWIEAFEKSHPEVMIDTDDGWNRGALRGRDDQADIARATAKTEARSDQRAIPLALTAVAIAYHLDGVSQLQLSAATLARIFDGRIKMWNDPAIAKDNPGIALPALAIIAVRAAETRPLSVAFAKFIARAAPGVWKLARGKTWPDGVRYHDFEPGRADEVKSTNGAISYVELPTAIALDLPLARVRNRSGAYVAATAASTTSAGEYAVVDAQMSFDPTDAKGAASYPIVYASWAVVDAKPGDAAKARWIRAYLEYVLGDGQKLLERDHYGRLPASLVKRALAALRR